MIDMFRVNGKLMIAKYKDERVRVEDVVGKDANIFIPSRQESVWVDKKKIKVIKG